MLDYGCAKKEFQQYLQAYDLQDDKIKLKVVHTCGVVACAENICRRMPEQVCSPQDRELAKIIALLHDIGRFEQLKRFNSFEPTAMDHAAFGVKLLFEENQIRRFVPEPSFDEIIKEAIAWHSDYRLPDFSDTRITFHAKLIRDADKLDNCRVKLQEAVETMLDMPAEAVGNTEITAKVWEQFCRKECITSSLRVTPMDYWLSYMAYFFDINFGETWEMIKEQEYIPKMIARIPYQNKQTEQKMQQAQELLLLYAEERNRGRSGKGQ